MHAAYLLQGQVMHDRLRPARNHFIYPVFAIRVDIDRLSELEQTGLAVNRRSFVAFHEADYGPRDGSSLSAWIRALLHEQGIAADGPVWLQTFPRVLGFVFNPVSFWFCHDKQGNLQAVLADVRNTFGESHRYLLTPPGLSGIQPDTRLVCRKVFHVSPFCEVAGSYTFRFRETRSASFVGIHYSDEEGLLLKTSIAGELIPLNKITLTRLFLTMPMLTLGVVARIHWQALKLWMKKTPFFRKPEKPVKSLSLSLNQEISHE